MKAGRYTRIGFCAALAVFLLVASIFLFQNKAEEIVNGKPESVWISYLGTGQEHRFEEELGTNALPVLLKAVEKRDGLFGTPFRRAWPKLPGWLQRRWPQPVDSSRVRMTALALLGRGNNAGILIPIAENNHDPRIRAVALDLLIFDSGRKVTMVLIGALHDKDERVRLEAIVGLSLTAREQDAATVSAILNSLGDKSPQVRFFAVTTLASDSSMAMKALPELRKAALDKDQRVREAAAAAISKFGGDANTVPK